MASEEPHREGSGLRRDGSCENGAVAKGHILRGLKTTELYSEFWRLEVRNQGISRAMLPPKALRKKFSLPLPIAFVHSPWLVDTPLQLLPPSSQGLIPSISVSLYASSYKKPVTGFSGFRAHFYPV